MSNPGNARFACGGFHGLALACAPFLLAVGVPHATAQERVLTIYGKDKCPVNTICVTRPESERYRIPKELRDQGPLPPDGTSWAVRSQSMNEVGRSGTGSCSAIGAGGWTGCWKQQMDAARAEREAQKREQTYGQP